jgi:hypothetical protein
VIGLALVAGVLVAAGSALACEAEVEIGQSGVPESAPSAAAAVFAPLFVNLAESVAPMPVYGLAEIPAGAAVPAEWLPVIDLDDPAAYEGPVTPNPRVLGGDGRGPEAQLVLQYEDGWLVLVANFRGDLGDVTGSEIGTIGGHAARLHEVNGGLLVQWSDGGRWYGVFGRGLAPDIVVDIALQMQVIPAAAPQ